MTITRVCLPFSPDLLGEVPDVFEYTVADPSERWSPEALAAQLYVPSYLFSGQPAEVVARMPDLQVIQTLTAGYEQFLPVPDGVTLCNAAGVHDAATSELAVGLAIAAQRELPRLLAAQRRHEWDQQMASSLADRRVLVIGAGSIGRAIARRLHPFECAVTLVGRSAREGVRAVAELDELLPTTDIVILIVPLTEQTAGLVDARFLALLPDDALVVNMARGKVVDTAALVAELTTGRLRAALDVTDPEPLPPDHPLWDLPNVIVSAHTGGASSAMWPRAYRLVADQLRAVAEGRPLANVIDA